jgi:hypothetical protein
MQIIENCLPPLMFKRIQFALTDWGTMPYNFAPTTAYTRENNNIKDYSWYHVAFEDGQPRSNISEMLENAIIVCLDKANIEIEFLKRIRIGLMTATETPYRHLPHTDQTFPHMTGLLYINDSDGDTHFYNKRFDYDDAKLPYAEYEEKYMPHMIEQNVEFSLTPKANTVAIFPGDVFHSSCTPTQTRYRLAINFNFTIKQ